MTTYTCPRCGETMEVDEAAVPFVNGVAELPCFACDEFYVIHKPVSAGFGGCEQ